jgi:hypothetical protein
VRGSRVGPAATQILPLTKGNAHIVFEPARKAFIICLESNRKGQSSLREKPSLLALNQIEKANRACEKGLHYLL